MRDRAATAVQRQGAHGLHAVDQTLDNGGDRLPATGWCDPATEVVRAWFT
jgi:hypothetical protein